MERRVDYILHVAIFSYLLKLIYSPPSKVARRNARDLCSEGHITPSCSHMHVSFPYAVLVSCQTVCWDWGLIRCGGPCRSTNQHRRDLCSFSVTNSAKHISICTHTRTPSLCPLPHYMRHERLGRGRHKPWGAEEGWGGFRGAVKLAVCDYDSFDSQKREQINKIPCGSGRNGEKEHKMEGQRRWRKEDWETLGGAQKVFSWWHLKRKKIQEI